MEPDTVGGVVTSPGVTALLGALAVLAGAVAIVRPVAVLGGSRPRLPDVTAAPPAGSQLPCPGWFAEAACRADLPEPHGRWWLGSITATGAGGLIGLVLGGPFLAALFGLGAVAGMVAALHSGRHRRDERLARGVPDSLDAIARASRAGSSVVQALASLDCSDATAADRLLASVAARVERGESLRVALESLLDRHRVPAVRLAVAALLVGTETGAAPGRAVEGVAATLRDRAALDREMAANASQAKASVAVLVLAPLGFAVFAVATDPRVGDFLFRSAIGWLCLGAGLGLDALGWLWMRSIMRSAR